MSETVMTAANSKLHDDMCGEFVDWCAAQGIPCDRSADEMLMFGAKLTESQYLWLTSFCERWDAAFPVAPIGP